MPPAADPRVPGHLGRTGLSVPPLGFGTSPLASMAPLYGYDVPERRAVDTVLAVFEIDNMDERQSFETAADLAYHLPKRIFRLDKKASS